MEKGLIDKNNKKQQEWIMKRTILLLDGNDDVAMKDWDERILSPDCHKACPAS